MLGIDVIALFSYNQVQFRDEGLLSLTYWTLIGAYVAQGERTIRRPCSTQRVYETGRRAARL